MHAISQAEMCVICTISLRVVWGNKKPRRSGVMSFPEIAFAQAGLSDHYLQSARRDVVILIMERHGNAAFLPDRASCVLPVRPVLSV